MHFPVTFGLITVLTLVLLSSSSTAQRISENLMEPDSITGDEMVLKDEEIEELMNLDLEQTSPATSPSLLAIIQSLEEVEAQTAPAHAPSSKKKIEDNNYRYPSPLQLPPPTLDPIDDAAYSTQIFNLYLPHRQLLKENLILKPPTSKNALPPFHMLLKKPMDTFFPVQESSFGGKVIHTYGILKPVTTSNQQGQSQGYQKPKAHWATGQNDRPRRFVSHPPHQFYPQRLDYQYGSNGQHFPAQNPYPWNSVPVQFYNTNYYGDQRRVLPPVGFSGGSLGFHDGTSSPVGHYVYADSFNVRPITTYQPYQGTIMNTFGIQQGTEPYFDHKVQNPYQRYGPGGHFYQNPYEFYGGRPYVNRPVRVQSPYQKYGGDTEQTEQPGNEPRVDSGARGPTSSPWAVYGGQANKKVSPASYYANTVLHPDPNFVGQSEPTAVPSSAGGPDWVNPYVQFGTTRVPNVGPTPNPTVTIAPGRLSQPVSEPAYTEKPKSSVLPSYRGSVPFYSQTAIDSHYRRVSQHHETPTDSEFEDDSPLLQWYVQRAQQVLQQRHNTTPSTTTVTTSTTTNKSVHTKPNTSSISSGFAELGGTGTNS